MTEETRTEAANIRDEAGPIVVHTIVVTVLLGGAMAVGAGLALLEAMFPRFAPAFSFLKQVDIAFVVGVFCLFVLHTMAILVTRLHRSLTREMHKDEVGGAAMSDEGKR